MREELDSVFGNGYRVGVSVSCGVGVQSWLDGIDVAGLHLGITTTVDVGGLVRTEPDIVSNVVLGLIGYALLFEVPF